MGLRPVSFLRLNNMHARIVFLLFAFLFFAVSLKNINFAVKAAGGRWHLRQLTAHARTLNITYGNK